MRKQMFYIVFAALVISLGLSPLSAQSYDIIDFEAKDINGKTIKLSDFNDKVVVLDFWATWCPPCRKEIPHLVDIKNTFKGKDFEIISVDGFERGSTDAALKFIKENRMNWIHVLDKKKGREIAQKYHVQAIPTMYIIKNGKIVASGLRGKALKDKIKELVN
jgi:thiol-disulfide isomerase/thioredoxin